MPTRPKPRNHVVCIRSDNDRRLADQAGEGQGLLKGAPLSEQANLWGRAFLKGTKNSNRPRRAQGRKPGNRSSDHPDDVFTLQIIPQGGHRPKEILIERVVSEIGISHKLTQSDGCIFLLAVASCGNSGALPKRRNENEAPWVVPIVVNF
jgi:hypothetical protein